MRELRKLFDVRGKRLKDEGEARQRAAEQAAEDAGGEGRRGPAFRRAARKRGGVGLVIVEWKGAPRSWRGAGDARRRSDRAPSPRTRRRAGSGGTDPEDAPAPPLPLMIASAATSMAPAAEGHRQGWRRRLALRRGRRGLW